jgi:pimeloyl-ACP methyl ester carboxylesterase
MRMSERLPYGAVCRKRRWAAAMALLVLLGAGCSTVVKNVHQAVYSKPTYGTDRFVLVRGYNIHYVEGGEGPPVLLIPGAFTTYRTWNRVLPALSLQNRFLAVDYVGVGDSDKPEMGFDYTIEEQADVMAEMVLALGLSRVNVVGASYGGAVALNLAARYPHLVGKVVCIEGGALITPEALNYSTLGDLIEWPILGSVIWGFMKSGLFDGITARSVMGAAWDELSPEERKEITGIFSANIMTASRSSWISIYRTITHRIDFIESVEQTRVPVLYLYGKDSKYRAVAEMNARRFEEHNSNIEVISFRRGIHELHLQYPGDVARMILRFMGTEPGIVASGTATPGAGEHADFGETIP